MKDILFRTKAYVKYKLKAHHRRGFGIHSPFVFHLLNYVVFEKCPYYAFRGIEACRAQLLQSQTYIDVVDYGTGSGGRKCVSSIARSSLESPSVGQLLFRLVNFAKSTYVLELGTSLGISTMYLAKARSSAQVHSIEGCPETAAIAKRNFEQLGISNVTLHVDNIDHCLSEVLSNMPQLDFLYIDANHRKSALLDYWRRCLPLLHRKSVCVVDDIHLSAEMEEAWEEIKNDSSVRVALDLFRVGVLFFDDSIPRQSYIVAF